MKKIILTFLAIFSILHSSTSFLQAENLGISSNQNNITNTEKNIKKAQLLESEVLKFKKKLLALQNKYLLKNDSTLQKAFSDIDEIIIILKKIQTTKINKSTANYVIGVVINDLKNINLVTKNHLTKIKDKFESDREKYNKLALGVSEDIDKIISVFMKYYSKKENYSSTDKKILSTLYSLQKKSRNLKNFYSIYFENTYQTKTALIRMLKSIKSDMINMRNIIKENIKR